MIDIVNKEDCVGCNGCVQRCPVSCITMHHDEQGCLYPKVDLNKCIGCSLCERVCPVINQEPTAMPIKVMAAINTNYSIREQSSSGGIFMAIAKKVIDNGGIVFGAKFDDKWFVRHDYTDNNAGLSVFTGAKYIQSQIGDSYLTAEQFLKSGREVLFSGTPCQIAGLKLFLRKDYGKLLTTVDVVCHGVPAPVVWDKYLKYIKDTQGIENVSKISFRDKRYGWERYSLNIKSSTSTIKDFHQNVTRNIYLRGYIKNLYLRPSCYKCPSKCGKSKADITLGDFWHIRDLQPEFYHFNGVSLVLANSVNGSNLLDNSGIVQYESTYAAAVKANPALVHSSKKPTDYNTFWDKFNINGIESLKPFLAKYSESPILTIKATLTNRVKKALSKIGIIKP